MTAYRVRYEDIRKLGGTVVAVSTDSLDDQCRFKKALSASYPMIADSDAKLVKLYDVKMPIVDYAKRVTYVVASDGRIAFAMEGNDAIDPSPAIAAVEKLNKESKTAGSEPAAPAKTSH